MTPPRVRPLPIRTDDSNAFARFSMQVRVPEILDEVIERNPDYPARIVDAVRKLQVDIRNDAHLPPLGFPAPDAAEWEAELAARAGETWLASDWFFAECYVYRCLVAATRFWETRRDPFAPAKAEENGSARLWEAVERALALEARDPSERLDTLLLLGLWGNRVDLSYAAGVAFGPEGESADLIIDDRAWAVPRLLAPGGDVHIIADNAGSELAMDLALADALMSVAGARITLHVKFHPTFVSDATSEDVRELMAAMDRRRGGARGLAARLGQAFDEGRFALAPDPFWNGPRFLWDRPRHLGRVLEGASMVISKGDANYRRALGDAIWPDGTFDDATDYWSGPLLCLRTLKSDALAGLSPAGTAHLDQLDPKWRINGRRGVIQAKRPQ